MKFCFLGLEQITESIFKEYPIWIKYEDPEQDEEIMSWGVDLDCAWGKKLPNKEDEYYFPFFGGYEPPMIRGTMIYCKVLTPLGLELTGLLKGGFAFSVFHEGKAYQFNINAPDISKISCEFLCGALLMNELDVFPLKYVPVSELFSGKSLLHSKFW